MTFDKILTLMPTFTAITAIVAPVITTIITLRSNERTKRLEIYSPRVYDAVKRMTDNYSALRRQREFSASDFGSESNAAWRFTQDYKKLLSSCYEVMSLIPDDALHTLILDFLSDLDTRLCISQEQDRAFHEISATIARILKRGKLKICESNSSKHKRRQAK